MADAVPCARRIGTVVNTHANGDHCFGNQLVKDSLIIASRAAAEEMAIVTPAVMAAFVRSAAQLGPGGEFFARLFGPFEFEGIELTPPSRTFEGELHCQVGEKEVRLVEVGPAHTRGDVIVELPADGVVFTGDILFVESTPILWEGPVGNWIRACDRILALKPRCVVPGHGPLTDAAGVRGVRDYLVHVRDEARLRYDAGLSAADAARDIGLGRFARWSDAERLAVNVDTLYREFSGSREPADRMALFALMSELAR